MSFFLVVGFYVVTLWLMARHRHALARLFMRARFPPTGAALLAAITFSTIEEGVLNLTSGTLVVLVATVPVLTLFVFVVGKVGQWTGAKTIRYPLIGLVTTGLLFESFLGGHREGFQHPESLGTLVFGIALTLITYSYVSIVSLTIAIEGTNLKARDGVVNEG